MKIYPLTAKISATLAMGMCLMLFTAKNGHATPTPTVDLTIAGSSGTINGARFLQADPHPAGSGYGALNAFLKIHSTENIESGYNTDYRYGNGNGPSTTEFDQFTDHHTRALLLAEIPTIDIMGSTYREFILDINEPVGNPGTSLLSLDALQIYLGDGPELHDYNTSSWNAHSELIYDMDAGNDNWVGMDFNTNKGGSGWGDAYILIPEIFFTVSTNEYVYLYSKFGENWANDNNFEEWGVGASAPTPTPEPATMLLFGTGLAGLTTLLRRRQGNA